MCGNARGEGVECVDRGEGVSAGTDQAGREKKKCTSDQRRGGIRAKGGISRFFRVQGRGKTIPFSVVLRRGKNGW